MSAEMLVKIALSSFVFAGFFLTMVLVWTVRYSFAVKDSNEMVYECRDEKTN